MKQKRCWPLQSALRHGLLSGYWNENVPKPIWKIESAEYWEQKDAEREARIESQEDYAKQLRLHITGSAAEVAPEDAIIARMVRDLENDRALMEERW